MANRTIGLDADLYGYLLEMGVREPEVLQQLREATEKEELSIMRSAPEQCQMMALLLRLSGSKRVIEVGTYTGYATLWMALSLPEDGEIVSCDVSERWSFVARRFWEMAGVEAKVHLHLRPALETLDTLLNQGEEACFDFAFIDADKENYDHYFERCLKLIRPGGLIVIDNVLWGGSVIDEQDHSAATEAIRIFNSKLKVDARVDLSMLPIADGVTLAVKR
ncbi:putative O-methyltransferase YrrM [Mariprofundus ferrinatatus]|uniref:Putative O-methyltransferase YrrM n=1 Tax=Mariprofundus ferrinatatus TaxID=1921087 RepID=A0A2K8L0T8_9PROT|nr:class I SAM-dependent methyltransferase [Mariprofundus ferrinatatus]ATX80908.1 putative O-methyltransferase YrrM [Mariprofundus ferrinatatus]